jgi:ectoine hydroxylase-related dioxygenase (phytanoyl-CoA dioxygenase family)
MPEMAIQMTTQERVGNNALSTTERRSLKKSFEEDGYFIVKNVVSPTQLAELHQNLTTTFKKVQESGELFSGGGLVSGHLNCFPGAGSRFVYEALEARGIVDLIREIEPKAIRLPNIGCNFNLPGSVTQHYHADRNFTKAFMIANVAVVDTVVENGAIELIAGTHRKFYKYWRFALERPYRNSIRVPMKQGDIMVRTSNVWHRGKPNKTAVVRPMLALTWEDGGSTHADPFAVENGKIIFRPNWFRSTPLGRIRERVFVAVPASYSAYRIVSSLVGNKGY